MTDQAPAVTVDTDDRSVLTRLAVRSADIARNWRISRLSLRTRVLLMFSLGALLLAVFLFGESFPPAKFAGYAAIWAGLLLFSAEGLWRNWRNGRARG